MKIYLLLLSVLLALVLPAQPPAGYYNSAAGQHGAALQQALHDIIDNHTVVSYDYLWTAFETTDKKPNGKVWDMYSDIPGSTPPYEYSFGGDQCGNYNGEGDCYNREHSWPKSWFSDKSPMYSDLFHLYPTDGYVNNKRSNYPYGKVGSADWTSQNGSKLGESATPGYSGTVFEPIDAYKGDFARSYFYMSTRYLNEDAGWEGSDMTQGAELLPWAVTLLLQWNQLDPVSQKETDRNNTVYGIQKNRNPFIDHPEYADAIWSPNAGIADYQVIIPLLASPNPCNESITLSLPLEGEDHPILNCVSANGVMVSASYAVTGNTLIVNTGDLPAGLYEILIRFPDKKQSYRSRIIKHL